MVSQAIEEQVVDPVQEEPQTEAPAEEQLSFTEDAAATAPEEAATPELDPRYQALIAEAARKAADEATQQTRQQYIAEQQQAQRRRQAENAQRANDMLLQQQREERLGDLLTADAVRLGLVDADLTAMKKTAARVVAEVEPIHRNAALNEAARVVTYLAQAAAGADPDIDLTPREVQMAGAFETSVYNLLRNPRLRDQIVGEERRKWEMTLDEEVAKRVDAELAKRQKVQKPVQRPANGSAPSTLDNSDSQRLLRLAGAGREPGLAPPTPEDVAWYQSKYGQRRRPSWQQP